MSTVHQALFGDSKGRHAVLSCSREKDAVVEAVRARSDLAPDRPAHVVWTPYVTGVRINDAYVVMRTAPDPEASRPGMVLTHAAFMAVEEAKVLDDIGSLLAVLPAVPTRDAVLEPTGLHAAPPSLELAPEILEALLGAVLSGSSPQLVGWIGPAGFERAARTVWRVMAPEERSTFSFSFAFNPRSTLTGSSPGVALVQMPRAVRDRWTSETVIDPENPHVKTPSAAVAALLGRPGGEGIRAAMDAVGLSHPALGDYALLESVARDLTEFVQGASPPAAVRNLAHALGKLAPSPDQATRLKADVAFTLAEGAGVAGDLLGLRNLDLSPFQDGRKVLARAAETWVAAALAGDAARAAADADVLTKALHPDAPQPWAPVVLGALKKQLGRWKAPYARVVWRWWEADKDLVRFVLDQSRPARSVERDIVAHAPHPIPHPELLLGLALPREMLLLYTYAHFATASPAEAFAALLRADPAGTRHDAFEHVAAQVDPGLTVLAAVSAPGVKVLVDLAGAAVMRTPRSLNGLDASVHGWRAVWASAVRQGAEVWRGVDDAEVQRDALFQHGDEPALTLLSATADTPLANILDHPERRHIWASIPTNLRGRFIDATARAWTARLQSGGNPEWDLEPELAGVVFDTAHNAVLFDPVNPGAVRLAVEAFGRSPILDQSNFVDWIERLARGPSLTKSDAVLLGSLVAQNGWERAASVIYAKAEWSRPDFWDAVAQFKPLLSFMQWGFFQLRSGKHQVHEGDWWSMLEEVAVDLLPSPPELEYVWEKAGGKTADLQSSGTGRSRAQHAVALVKKGKGVGPRRFLNALKKEYPSNNSLKIIDQIGRTVGVFRRSD